MAVVVSAAANSIAATASAAVAGASLNLYCIEESLVEQRFLMCSSVKKVHRDKAFTRMKV
jgi:hypothetical protein